MPPGRCPIFEVSGETRMANGVTLITPLHVTVDRVKAIAFGAVAYATGPFTRIVVVQALEEAKFSIRKFPNEGSAGIRPRSSFGDMAGIRRTVKTKNN